MTSKKYDCEVYSNYFLVMFSDGEDFELFDDWPFHNGQPIDRTLWQLQLARALRDATITGFNSDRFDLRLLEHAERGASNAELKRICDAIIVHKIKPWELADLPAKIDQVDLFNVAPGSGSLKSYAARMHSKRLQDLPIDPSERIDQEKRLKLREYCMLGDIAATSDLEGWMSEQLQLRRDMSAEYGIDLRSKSDAQIAEAIMRSLLPFRVQVPPPAYGAKFYYRPPEWLKFQSLDVLALLARSPFSINASGHVDMTDELASTIIRIGDSAYQMGLGGLHSTESCVAHFADDEWEISDHDVASYYPSLIIRTGIEPTQLAGRFQQIYREFYDRRITAKKGGDKKKANSLKTFLNGVFGKLADMFSIFYAPSEMVQVTLTGQLALLMLIEALELNGIKVISANTDGIVLKTRRSMTAQRDAIIKWWESVTGLVTEEAQYKLIASRDVNTYIAIKTDGEVKKKGIYADPVPGPSNWPSPMGQVSVEAAVAWLKDGEPIHNTVRDCTDIRQFVHVRGVKGGGSFLPLGPLPKKTTLKAMRALCGNLPKEQLLAAYEAQVQARSASRIYLGKTVRWYYAKGSKGAIVTPADSLVARTEGCAPCMMLPDTLPGDIDFEWYEREAFDILRDIGVLTAPSTS